MIRAFKLALILAIILIIQMCLVYIIFKNYFGLAMSFNIFSLTIVSIFIISFILCYLSGVN